MERVRLYQNCGGFNCCKIFIDAANISGSPTARGDNDTCCQPARASAGFWLWGGQWVSMPLAAWDEENFEKFDYEMVHSEVYLNKYVVSIAPFDLYTCLPWLLSKYNINIIIMSSMIPPTASLFRSSGELVWPCVYNACILIRGSRGPDIPEPPGGVHVNRA